VPDPVLIVPARIIPELVPLLVRVTAPLLLVVSPASVMTAELALSVKITEEGLLVTLETETAVAVSVMYTAPCVLREIVAALVFMFVPEEPIVPVPPINVSVPVLAMLSPAP
jgi:hypothetical protein